MEPYGFHRGGRHRAISRTVKGGQGGAAARRPDVSLQQRGRFRDARHRPSRSARSGSYARSSSSESGSRGPTALFDEVLRCADHVGLIERRYRFRYERAARKFSAGLFASGTGQYRRSLFAEEDHRSLTISSGRKVRGRHAHTALSRPNKTGARRHPFRHKRHKRRGCLFRTHPRLPSLGPAVVRPATRS